MCRPRLRLAKLAWHLALFACFVATEAHAIVTNELPARHCHSIQVAMAARGKFDVRDSR